MRRRIVNHHRLIKSIDRTAEKTERFFDKLFKSKGPRKIKDYTWKGTQYNPYKREDTSGRKKTKILLGVLTISVILLIYVIVFSGLFDIKIITVSGNDKIEINEITEVINNTLEYKSFGFIPNSSFFAASIEDISEVLRGRFPIDKITIEKHFPHEIHISITEKISTVIYDNGSVYGFTGLDGSVVELIRAVENYEWKDITEKISTTTVDGVTTTIDTVVGREHTPDRKKIHEQVGEYPIVYDKREHQTDKGVTVLKPEEAILIIGWYNELKNTDFGVELFIIENDTDFYIDTKEGWTIKTRFMRNNPAEQMREIKLALQKVENRRSISYIDIRYQNRIYWK